MKDIDDHNGAQWLVVEYLSGIGGGGPERREGWHVVRICPCHFGESVSYPGASREDAELALRGMLRSSQQLGIR